MTHKLVSVITPCYNGAKYIDRLLGSVLAQTHPRVEMVVIDDGSTDNSAEIIKSFIPKFKKKGYDLRYIYQENQGQSVAINRGLKLVTGDYLVWPDADDYYAAHNAISEMVAVLSTSDDKTSMVRVEYNVLDEKGKLINKLGVSDKTRHKVDLFEDCLFEYGRSFWGAAGGYMAKVEKIEELIPGREIYTEKSSGQNWQLCLPLLYKQKCLTIESRLYSIVAHGDSHSRNMATNNHRQAVYYRTIKNTLDRIPMDTDYKKHLMKQVQKMTIENKQPHIPRHLYRTYIKRLMKGAIPHGLVVLYKRRSH